jgi:hypothetical protein
LGGGGEEQLVVGAARSSQSQAVEAQDALQVREQHLDLLPLPPSGAVGIGPGDVPGHVRESQYSGKRRSSPARRNGKRRRSARYRAASKTQNSGQKTPSRDRARDRHHEAAHHWNDLPSPDSTIVDGCLRSYDAVGSTVQNELRVFGSGGGEIPVPSTSGEALSFRAWSARSQALARWGPPLGVPEW